jgi:hypothetical protein
MDRRCTAKKKFPHQYTSELSASTLLVDSRVLEGLLEDEMLLLNAVLLVLSSCGDLQLNEEMPSLLLVLEKTQEKALE